MPRKSSHAIPAAPRMIDIARRAGVSRMAVSAVLMGTGKGNVTVSVQTAERIREIAAELNYRPNAAAQMLARRKSNLIALVGADFKSFLGQIVLCWLHEAAESHGYRLMTATADHEFQDRFQHLLRDVRSGWVAGLVYLAESNEAQWPAISELLRDIPNAIVALGDLTHLGLPSVATDYADGTRQVVNRLVQQGRRCLAFVTEEADSKAIRTRLHAYRETVKSLGLPCRDELVIVETAGWMLSEPRFHGDFERLARRIRELGADGIICDGDMTAVALLNAFRRLGVRVPEDVAIIGWGNALLAQASDPALTTVSYDLPKLLTRAVARLDESRSAQDIDQGELSPPRTEFVQPLIISRQSG